MWLVIEAKFNAEELCKGQYCIVTGNVRFMNQSKLDMVKQEMVKMNINVRGINELKWVRNGRI